MDFSHVKKDGKAKMVDVSRKTPVLRKARAEGTVLLNPHTISMIRDNEIKKGDVLAVAKLAGIQGAKKTSDLIPLCHQLLLDSVDLSFSIHDDSIRIASEVICRDRTGVEMEALTAVSIAALTIYDMCKAADSSMVITDIKLTNKTKEPIS